MKNIESIDINSIDTEISSRIEITNSFSAAGFFDCTYVGNIRCYFPSKESGKPRVLIGPTWVFSLPILCIVFFLVYFLFQITLNLEFINWGFKGIGLILMTLDLYYYFYTLLADPGVPEDIWDHYFAYNINAITNGDEEA